MSLAGLVDWPAYLNPILTGAAVSLVTVLAVSRFTQVTDEEREYRESLFVAPPDDVEPGKIAGTLRVAYLTGGFGILAAVLMLGLFVLPLNGLKGNTIIAGLFSIEAVFAIGWSLVFAVSAYLVIYGARRSYVRRLNQ